MRPPLTLDDLIVDCCGGRGAHDAQLLAEIEAGLATNRAVLLRNTGMTEVAEMAAWAEFVGAPRMEYKYGTGFRYPMGGGVLSVGTEPPHSPVEPHCEMAYWKFYPRKVLFGCESIPARGGETVIADNRRVTEDILPTEAGRKILERGIRYIRNFSDRDRPDSIPSMKHWQDNFGLEARAELRQYCGEMEWDLLERADGSVQVSYPEEGYEYDPVSGTDLFFTSITRLGRCFDEWPPFDRLPSEQRPYHLTYADGGDFSAQDLATIEAVFARYSVPITWQPGDIAVLDNIAWTHARPAYELQPGEERRIGLLVSEPVDRRRIVTLRRQDQHVE
ncbi:MAG: TauD/TfdA family dioxygenase [Gammaproteobacteria bacterium]|nr:TauD/TfdA family dioxygenase [Gammaproteobacteria bacterium]